MKKKYNTIVRNVPTKDLLLLLAKVNSSGDPYIDVIFDMERGAVLINPVSLEEHDLRISPKPNKQDLNIQGLINEQL